MVHPSLDFLTLVWFFAIFILAFRIHCRKHLPRLYFVDFPKPRTSCQPREARKLKEIRKMARVLSPLPYRQLQSWTIVDARKVNSQFLSLGYYYYIRFASDFKARATCYENCVVYWPPGQRYWKGGDSVEWLSGQRYWMDGGSLIRGPPIEHVLPRITFCIGVDMAL